eukprot:TRINITY_DN23495_c0_g1_i1.p1 TRINITY_DN23495_c0_g1~~TRINITY_DN23495_c0_g1_i1.p1  ORF type:complete len:204 (-),score=37.40 TRINITY_DN23495_c0_g1_i1:76-687(-)
MAALDVFYAQAEAFLMNPANREYLQVVKGGINGALYGAKIRFPHALVMTFLFRRNLSLQQKLRLVFRATKLHSMNLMRFVFLYKLLLLLLRRLNNGKQHHTHFLLAGFLGGGFVFGERNEVNMQINLYLLSRITQGLARLAVEKLDVQAPQRSFQLFGASVWAIVMWLFYSHKPTLQPSLQASMTQLYLDSQSWTDPLSFFSL